MAFQPSVNEKLLIDGVFHYIAEHPAATGMPYGQEGRQAIVYQLIADRNRHALKVFKPRYRVPASASLSERLKEYAHLPGLAVCRRTVLVPEHHATLLTSYPDLTYAVIMPWIEGGTWWQVLVEKRELPPDICLALAGSLAKVLSRMEQEGLAHCDLSGPNVLLPELAGGEGVGLVDVEQMYGPGLHRPSELLGGSPGYAHKTTPESLWVANADRFAGAILLAEMLGWCDKRVRAAAWGESYFDPQEMHLRGERYRTLLSALQGLWGERVAGLFNRAWCSETLADCATFGDWLVALPEQAKLRVQQEQTDRTARPLEEPEPETKQPDEIMVLAVEGQRLEQAGNLTGALSTYRKALAGAPFGSSLREELALIVRDLERRVEAEASLEGMARQAQALEQAGRWREAAEAYWRLASQTGDARKRGAWELAQRRCEAEAGLADLFDQGMAAYQRGEWAQAWELLAAVVRQRPDYARGGRRAAELLVEVERQLRVLVRTPAHLSGLKTIGACATILGLGGGGVIVLGLVVLVLCGGLLVIPGLLGGQSPSTSRSAPPVSTPWYTDTSAFPVPTSPPMNTLVPPTSKPWPTSTSAPPLPTSPPMHTSIPLTSIPWPTSTSALRVPTSPPMNTSVPPTSKPWPTSTPVPSAKPTSTPAPMYSVDSTFSSAYSAVGGESRMGRAIGNAQSDWCADELFQYGYAFWTGQRDGYIFVVRYNRSGGSNNTRSGTWSKYRDTYKGESLEQYSPPSGWVQPKGGIGKVWIQLGGPNAAIGWAKEIEQGFNGQYQYFEKGLMFWSNRFSVSVLFNNGTWQRVGGPNL